MKNILLFLSCIALVPVWARAQISVGPAAGVHLTRYMTKAPDGSSMDRSQEKKVPDLQAGAIADIHLGKRLHLQPGLMFTTNSYKLVGEEMSFGVYSNYYNIRSLELPVNLTLHSGKQNRGHFFFSAGAFLAYNVSGRRYVQNGWISVPEPGYGGMEIRAVQVPETDEKLKFGSDKPADYRRIGAGAGLNAGYQLKNGLFARVHFQQGLRSQLLPQYNNVKTSSSNFGLTLGFLFQTKSKKAHMDGKEQ